MIDAVYCCFGHIEECLESFLDEFENMPILEKNDRASEKCNFCKNDADYKLVKSEVRASWE